MYQVFLPIHLPILPRDTQQILEKQNRIANQDICYRSFTLLQDLSITEKEPKETLFKGKLKSKLLWIEVFLNDLVKLLLMSRLQL